MSDKHDDFLRFSAYSIKELITRKLAEDTKFTDQIYEGSNLAVLIDIVSYMYQALIYQLNNAASESMFADTQLYENISRLCKFIGYHPEGFKSSTLNLYIQNTGEIKDKQIYPCSYIETNLNDSLGNPICFSTVFERTLGNEPVKINDDTYTNVVVMNGRWKYYSTVFTANGTDYETFILNGLKSDSEAKKYVVNNKIQVVVEKAVLGVDGKKQVQLWNCDPNEIFIQAFDSSSSDAAGGVVFSKLYNNDDQVYTAYLNEQKIYEIKFGNGILGQKLEKGDKVHVFYLESNGPDGYIDLSLIDWSKGVKFKHSAAAFGLDEQLYRYIFKRADRELDDNIADININITFDPNSLTKALPEEDVEDIREKAPQWFKTGNRLITKEDYEFFIKAHNSDTFAGVIDVKCMNNWDYLTTFYRWLYNLGLNPIEYYRGKRDAYRYLSKSRLIQQGYQYVDSADANNIYLWIATQNSGDIKYFKSNLNNSIGEIKTMTSETYPLAPIDVYFDISFTPTELYFQNLNSTGDNEFDIDNSYLEVTISDNSIFSNTTILNKISQVFEDKFSNLNCRLGQSINYDDILNQLYAINGVERIRTVYYPKDYLESENFTKYKSRACDGISFASWSSTKLIDDVGIDLQINNTIRTLEDFQFPVLVPGFDLKKKIKIIKRSMNTTNPVKF